METNNIRIFEGEKYSAALTTTNQLVIWNNATRTTLYFKAKFDTRDPTKDDYVFNDSKAIIDTTLSKGKASSSGLAIASPTKPVSSSSALALYSSPSYMATPDPTPDPYSIAGALALSSIKSDSQNFQNILIFNPPSEYKEIGIYEDSNEKKTFYYLLALSKSNELYKFEIKEQENHYSAPDKIILKNGEHLQVGRTFKKLLVVKDRALALDSNGRIYPISKNIQKISQAYTNISFKTLTMTDNHFVGVSENDTLIAWGYCNEGNIDFSGELLKNNVKEIFSGENVSVILYKSGAIEVKGNDKAGQISDASIEMNKYIFDPTSKSPSAGPLVLGLNPIVTIAVTDNLCFALLNEGQNGSIKIWGKDKEIYENKIPKIVTDSKILGLYPGRKSIYCLIERVFNGEPSYSFVTWGVSINKEKFVMDPDYSSSDVYIPDLFFSKSLGKGFAKEPSIQFDIDFKKHGFSSNNLEELLSSDSDKSIFRFRGKLDGYTYNLDLKRNMPTIFTKSSIDKRGTEDFSITPLTNDGKVFTLDDPIDGKNYILKMVTHNPILLKEIDFYNSLRDEALNQIILYNQKSINICGKLKYVLLDSEDENPYVGYIIQEKFDIEFSKVIKKFFDPINNIINKDKYIREKIILTAIFNLCKKLKMLERSGLEFNHRDLKLENIMLSLTPDPEIYLIDFGNSCIDLLSYKTGFDATKFSKTKCYKESRDLSFLFIWLYKQQDRKINPNYFSPLFYNKLESLLITKIKDTDYFQLENPYEPITNLQQVYTVLNKSYIYNENTTVDSLLKSLPKIIQEYEAIIAITPP